MDPAIVIATANALASLVRSFAPVVEAAMVAAKSDDAEKLKAAIEDLQRANDEAYTRTMAKLLGR